VRIVIDMQRAQIESSNSGNAPLSIALVQGIVRNRGEHQIILVLNGLLSTTIKSIYAAFHGLLPKDDIRIWYSPGPVCECEPGNEWRRQTAEIIRESFIASLSPELVYTCSMFEGFSYNAVTSIGKVVPDLVTVVTLVNIPPIEERLASPTLQNYVNRKVEELQRANFCGILSSYSAEESTASLGLDMSQITVGPDSPPEMIDAAAKTLLQSFNLIREQSTVPQQPSTQTLLIRRPKLAYISPLPPERSGISDYSADLLPELARYYDIEVVIDQECVSNSWITENCTMHSVEWFRTHTHHFDRVLYHFGNSEFHKHMFSLLQLAPGVVTLHDFFLSDLVAYRDMKALAPNSWADALYHSHGYHAVRQRFQSKNLSEVVGTYPCNFHVLEGAQGIIVHSETSNRLRDQWYGEHAGDDWAIIPLLRVPAQQPNRESIRKKLKLAEDAFLVCSFGMLGRTKLNHRLLTAWIASNLYLQPQCILVFVGENPNGEYGQQLLKTIRECGIGDRVRITGWADATTFRDYLTAADLAVQLRTLSRGESSAAVLDCMNYSVATIVNRHGSMADLPTDAVWMLPDEFEDHHLVDALETLRRDSARRKTYGKRAREIVFTKHSPEACAAQYAEAIERFHLKQSRNVHTLINAIAALDCHNPIEAELKELAQSIAKSFPTKQPARQLLIDVSATCRYDLKTGIERVARALTMALLDAPPQGYRIEPVYLSDEGGFWHYRYARRYTLDLLDCAAAAFDDEIVETEFGDLLLGVDLSGNALVEAARSGLFERFRDAGVAVYFIVYDLLPVLLPQFFPPNTDGTHSTWLRATSNFDGVICISQAVASEYKEWLATLNPAPTSTHINWFHLGADVSNSAPTRGIPKEADRVLSQLASSPSFLMVGTVEPRKGYLQTLDVFSQLWAEGYKINLVIVGNEGWKGLSNEKRRTIPETVTRLRSHPELGNRLFWLEGISDEYLEKVYAASTCLIAASEGEGFGLPLIEAAQHKLPIIARDIPVFREVAKQYAYYWQGVESESYASHLKAWLELYKADCHPKSEGMSFLTWKESAEQLKKVILGLTKPS